MELYAALAGIIALGSLAYASGHFNQQFAPSEARSVNLVPETNPYGFAEKNNTTMFNLNAFYNESPPKFSVKIEPELVVSMNAALPKEGNLQEDTVQKSAC